MRRCRQHFIGTCYGWVGRAVPAQVVGKSLIALCLLLVLAGCDVSIPARTTSAADAEVRAAVSNPTPLQNSPVTVSAQLTSHGQPVANVPMTATWHYKTSTPSCSGMTGANGVASCTRYIGGASHGYRVKISIRFAWNNQTYKGEASFTPR